METFLVVMVGEGGLQAASTGRPRMLPNALQGTGQSPTVKNYEALNLSAEVEKCCLR